MALTKREKAKIEFDRMFIRNKLRGVTQKEENFWIAGYISALIKGR